MPGSTEGFDSEVAAFLAERAEAVRERPDSDQAWYELGLAYEAHLLHEAALPCYEQAVQLGRPDAERSYRLAVARGRVGDFEGALDAVGQALALEPDYVPAHCREGNWWWELGEVDRALRSYAAALERAPGDPAAILGRVQVLLAQGRPQEALDALAGIDTPEPAARAVAHQLRGTALARLGRNDEARAELERGQGAQQYLPDPWSRRVNDHKRGAATRYFKADRLLDRGRVQAAIEILVEARAIQPDNAQVLRLLADAYARESRLEQAEEVLEDLIRVRPGDPDHGLALAVVRSRRGDPEGALAATEAVLEQHPRLPQAHEQRILLLAALLRWEEAVEAHGEAPPGLQAAALVAVGKSLTELQRPAEALELFSQAADADESLPDAWAGQALALLRLDRTDEARSAVERLGRLAPDHPLMGELRSALDR